MSTTPLAELASLSETEAVSVATCGPPKRCELRLLESVVADVTRLSTTCTGMVTVVFDGLATSTSD